MRRSFLVLVALAAAGSFAFGQEQNTPFAGFQGHWLASGCIGSSPFAIAFTINGDRVSWHARILDGKFGKVAPDKAQVTAHARIVDGLVDLTVLLGELPVHLDAMEDDKTRLVGTLGSSNLRASRGGVDQLGPYYDANARFCRN